MYSLIVTVVITRYIISTTKQQQVKGPLLFPCDLVKNISKMTELIITANVRLHSNFSNVRLNVYVYAHVYDDMDSGAQEAKEIQCPTPWNWSPWDCLMWILRTQTLASATSTLKHRAVSPAPRESILKPEKSPRPALTGASASAHAGRSKVRTCTPTASHVPT